MNILRRAAHLRWHIFVSISLLSISYLAFNFYVRHTALEIVNGWLQNEAINIQEGNLLSAITKNQRLLLSSDFIKGVSLVDTSRTVFGQLIELGLKIEPKQIDTDGRQLRINQLGPFTYVIGFAIPNSQNLVLGFLVAPTNAAILYWAFAVALIALTATFMHRATKTERQESHRRELLLRTALGDFVSGSSPSQMIVDTVPGVVSAWGELQARLQQSLAREVELASSAKFSDLARQTAHDIRSPLSLLLSLPQARVDEVEKQRLLELAVRRLTGIAEALLKQTRATTDELGSSQPLATIESVNALICVENQTAARVGDITIAIAELLTEKRATLTADVELISDLPQDRTVLCFFQTTELQSVVSNLITNAAEALTERGRITVSVRLYNDFAEVTVQDNGRGIPAEVVPKLFESGATFGKVNGNGLGLFSAKKTVENWGGKIRVQSRERFGTIVSVRLRRNKLA